MPRRRSTGVALLRTATLLIALALASTALRSDGAELKKVTVSQRGPAEELQRRHVHGVQADVPQRALRMAGHGLGDRLSVRRHQPDDRVSELTKTPISRDDAGDPNYWVVSATDPALFRCPYFDGG